MKSTTIDPFQGGQSKGMPANLTDNVVEIGLLLPAGRAAELFRLAQDRHESIGQVLRKLIESELARSA